MLDKREVAKNFDAVVARLADRGGALDLSQFKALFAERRALNIEKEALDGRLKLANEEMMALRKTDPAAHEARRPELKELGAQLKEKVTRLEQVEQAIDAVLESVPNLPHASVPTGKSEAAVGRKGQASHSVGVPIEPGEIAPRIGLPESDRAGCAAGKEAFAAGRHRKVDHGSGFWLVQ